VNGRNDEVGRGTGGTEKMMYRCWNRGVEEKVSLGLFVK